jgi:plastocyanin
MTRALSQGIFSVHGDGEAGRRGAVRSRAARGSGSTRPSPQTKLNEKANYKACFECHKPHDKQDFVISYPQIAMAGQQPMVAAVAPAAAAPDVTIAGFVFGPAKLTAASGKPVTWLNSDESPHQITLTGTGAARSPILMKGQTYSQAFAAPGVYNYICGLHPNMKGTVEVSAGHERAQARRGRSAGGQGTVLPLHLLRPTAIMTLTATSSAASSPGISAGLLVQTRPVRRGPRKSPPATPTR